MAASVPDSESLRRAALQASWQRGRWVARRRLWWRWTVWALLRVVLPAAAVLALLSGLAYGWSLMQSGPGEAPPAPAVQSRVAAPAPQPEVDVDPEREPAGSASLRLDWAAPARHIPKTSPTSTSSPASATTTNVGDSRP